jgi:hypothetical protein
MQNGTSERQAAAREGLRTALVTLAKVARTQERFHDAASASASKTKGPETGEPASGQGPSEPRGWSVLGWEARRSGTEGKEEGGRGTLSGQSTPSGQ